MIASSLVIISFHSHRSELISYVPEQTPRKHQASCSASVRHCWPSGPPVTVTTTRSTIRATIGIREWKQRMLSTSIQQFPHPFTVLGTELGARTGLGSGRGTCCERPDGAPRAVIRYSGYAEIPCSCKSSP